MIETVNALKLQPPIDIGNGELIGSVDQLAEAIVSASEAYAEKLPTQDFGDVEDFQIASDALNVWRALWRLREEYGVDLEADARPVLIENICSRREYEIEEFELALEATSNRPRCPFGLDPLKYAYLRSQKHPFTILHGEINDSVSRIVLMIAINLRALNRSNQRVLLPIEQLRLLLGCRKLVVSGAVQRLMRHNLLKEVGPKAHTGKAREFLVMATEGEDYQL
jgi:hypothetical protein